MFQAGEASPYDRLPKGCTLLHVSNLRKSKIWPPLKPPQVICEGKRFGMPERESFKWNYLLAHMLPFCDKVASERDKHGL